MIFDQLSIVRPPNPHSHLREGETLIKVLPFELVFAAVTAMGNLLQPVATYERAQQYRKEILSHPLVKELNPNFNPLMTIMLTEETTPGIINEACDHGINLIKLIPKSSSTNSAAGVTLFELINPRSNAFKSLLAAKKRNMIFLIHAELAFDKDGKEIFWTEREAAAIPFVAKLLELIPGLRIVIEHVSTKEMVEFVLNSPLNVAGSITPHHVLDTDAGLFDAAGAIVDPWRFCLPVLKSEENRQAVLHAMVSDSGRFFFGGDSAFHSSENKLKTPPNAGIFSGPVLLNLLWERVFAVIPNISWEEKTARFENFVSIFGPKFYGLLVSKEKLTFVRKNWTCPEAHYGTKIFTAGNNKFKCQIEGWDVLHLIH